MCMHIAEKLGVEGAKKHGLTDRMEFRKKSNGKMDKMIFWVAGPPCIIFIQPNLLAKRILFFFASN